MKPVREPGGILLLSCYELGHPPHGLAMPLAFLRRAGFAPAALDLSLGPLDEEAVRAARLVAISVPMHTALRLGVRAAELVRGMSPEAHIAFFGLYAALCRRTLEETLGPVSVLAGEHEEALCELAARLDGGKEPPPTEEQGARLTRLRFPAPARDGLPALERYARLLTAGGAERLAGYTETTRGCLDLCRHCPVPAIYGGRFFAVPAERVLEDVAAQVERGAGHITFGDPDFLNGPAHGMKILRELHRRFPALSFDITAQVKNLSRRRELIPELAELGCAFVVSAVESLSDRVLAKLGKRHRRADVEEVLEIFRRADLVLKPTLVTFTPWTTLEEMRELCDFLGAEGLAGRIDPVQLSVRLLVPPGSLLLRDPATAAAFGPLDPAGLTHVWEHEDPMMDRLQRDIAALVEEAAAAEADPVSTFESIRARVYRAAGMTPPARRQRPPAPAPRLTEPWFC